ncbi:type I secretion C-terminal target domain-containing protein [Vibrio sonorensis]|uniref:type I secretion C-terminal target domain-containing protein n=1 Tax=Vibrio sonorensis TaxID=1004316 RepID=UPI00247FD966|nr:type I secretion C-terminal target domain-containing protein [Vibrio sonorensis]
MTGGDGIDIFVWHEIQDGAQDKITDFSLNDGDQIDLRDVLPELKEQDINMATLFSHIDAVIVNQKDIELYVHPDGVGHGEQSIVIEELAMQYDYTAMSSDEIVSTLVAQQVLMHDT